MKIATTAAERLLLEREVRGNAAARHHPFWRDLPVRVARLGGLGLGMRRFRDVGGAEDNTAICGMLDARLGGTAGFPRGPILPFLQRRRAMSLLAPSDQDMIAVMVGGATLPRTSMHGDLHVHNFVRHRRNLRVIDWEHFDAEGSFIHDFMDFHLDAERRKIGVQWPDFLASLSADHPVLAAMGSRLGLPPRALLAHYVLIRADVGLSRPIPAPRPGEEESRCARFVTAIRRAIAGALTAISLWVHRAALVIEQTAGIA